MMESADVKVKVIKRQSKDYATNFNAKHTPSPKTEDSTLDDIRFKCWCHEVLPNQRAERCSSGLDETPPDKSSGRNSVSSIQSFDSGYDSKRCTRFLSISEFDE
ncbi:uncharacterized protein zgc:194007 [Puntigrus tetrazona]|uniref:uncharacterized protein zgc:194007 n=1 Tax=Puntigrus tetrazona TaxID=1606681 RepID=UPI001C8ADBB3|nr:uncharacterized protein zgc:194007 [Puntigrus tetrazona]